MKAVRCILLAIVVVLSGSEYLKAQSDDTLWIRQSGTSAITSLDVSRSGRYVAAGDSTGRLLILQPATGTILRSFNAHTESITTVRFSPLDSNVVATSSHDGVIQEWLVPDGIRIGDYLNVPVAPVTAIDLGPVSPLIAAVYDPPETRIRFWDRMSKDVAYNFTGNSATIRRIAFDPTETYMVTTEKGGVIRFSQLDTKHIMTLTVPDECTALALTGRGPYVAAASTNGTIYLWKGGSGPYPWGKPPSSPGMQLSQHRGVVTGGVFTADGKYLVSSGSDSTVRVWSVATGANVYTYHYPSEQRCVAVSGEYIVSGTANGKVILWHLKYGTGRELPAPELLEPEHLQEFVSRAPALRWHAVEEATQYIVQLGDDSTMMTGLVLDDVSTSDTTMVPGTLPANAKLYWRVRAAGVDATSPWSVRRQFTTGTDGPVPPLLILPVNQASQQPTTITLQWHSVPKALGYRVQVSSYDSLFKVDVARDLIVQDTSVNISGLDPYAVYYWHVRAENQLGFGAWSPAWSFGTVGFSLSVTPSLPDVHQSCTAAMSVMPNPVHGIGTIDVQMMHGGDNIWIGVYNPLGQRCSTIFNGAMSETEHRIRWDATALPSGMYYLVLESSDGIVRRAVIIE